MRNSIMRVTLPGLAIAALALFGSQPGFAQTNEPANKPAVAINRGSFTFLTDSAPVRILSEKVKLSKPTDLLLSVTAESSIVTNLVTTGNSTSSADGKIKVYITINGEVVFPAGTPPEPEPGHARHGDTDEVVFANQTYSRTTMYNADDQDHRIETYLRTKHAAGFNWAVLNAGEGSQILNIEVWAVYDETETSAPTPGQAMAEGVIGTRSLVVQPVKCQVDETVFDQPADDVIVPPITLN